MFAPYCKTDDVVLFQRRHARVLTAFAGVFAGLLALLPVLAWWALSAGHPVSRGLAAGLLLFLRTTPGSGFITVLIPAMLVTGAGMGLGFVGVTIAATTGVPDRDQGIASGLINTSQQVGTAVGLAILVTIAGSVMRASHAQPAAAVVAGYHAAFVVAAAIAVAAALIALIVLRRPSALPADAAETVSPRLMQPRTAAAQSQLLLARCGPLLPPNCVDGLRTRTGTS